ncbi:MULTISPECIES: phosphatase PAP2 family protein [Zoogloea]|uniref:phosphatase PAP2 family protein n=1 Tax=Zoogloea TaxID=349 RepID=UPI001FE3A2C5|nr:MULTISPECIES: phosphatase PAP2 family protein [Zoogloea]MDD2670003.1 phosphatase PAP2 family protein [Zoogloea sp.]MDY0035556.1 phosphatase PAP2 family protein [Zoogloea oleivorans]
MSESRVLRLHEPASPDAPAGPAARPVGAEVLARLRHLWWLKAAGTSLFMVTFFTAYLHLLKQPLFPVIVMPLTWVDRVLGFQPWSLVAYASLWFYVSLPPALAPSRARLFSYGWHIGSLCLAGILFFIFWPTAVPPANVDWGLYPGYALLKGIDAGGNACPSLHVATALYSALWLNQDLRDMGAGRGLRRANWLWCGLIVFSTLVTKQHVMLDVLAGAALALVVAVLSPGLKTAGPVLGYKPRGLWPGRKSLFRGSAE